jgi:hypothetical protein
MSALARTTEINCDTRAANEDCINGGSRTRTKYAFSSDDWFDLVIGETLMAVVVVLGWFGAKRKYESMHHQ